MSLLIIFLLLSGEAVPRVEETIVVTGERLEQPASETAAALTVLERSEIERLPAFHLADALRFVPGLQVITVDTLGIPMISSRGFFGGGEVEYVQLIVDGAPVHHAESGIADWRSVPVEWVDRVEILRGPGSSMFGDIALGGVVQVFSRPRTAVTMSFGNLEMFRTTAAFAGDGFHGALSVVSAAGFRDHSSGREWNGSAGIRAGRITFDLDVLQRARDEPGARSAAELRDAPFGSDPLFRFDRDETRRVRLAARSALAGTDVAAYGHWRDAEIVRTLLLAPGFGDRALRRLDTKGGGLAASREWRFSDAGRIVAGADVSRDSLDSSYLRFEDRAGELLARGNGTRTRAALFTTAEWRPRPRLRFAAGARWDRIADAFDGNDRVDGALSPRLAVAYEASDSATLWMTASRSFKAPTLDQRFDLRPLPDFTGGTFTVSNSALRPQTATMVEAGARGRLWEAVAYEMRVDDEIDFDLATFRYGNIGRSLHRGLEVAARTPPALLQPEVTYAWTRVESLEGPHRGRQLKNIAEHLLRGNLHIRSVVDAVISVEHARGRFLDDANTLPLDASTVVDLVVRRPIGAASVALEIRNAFDELYAPIGFTLGDEAYYFPAAGRSVTATVSWRR